MINNVSKIVRIKNVNFPEVDRFSYEDALYKFLKEQKFELSEKSADGFLETYSNENYKNDKLNTIVMITRGGVHGDHLKVICCEAM